jgi:hypothetical protein
MTIKENRRREGRWVHTFSTLATFFSVFFTAALT